LLVIKSLISILLFLTLFGVASPLSITLAQTNETEIPTEDTLLYDNPNLGFTLEYPFDWAKEESITFVSPMSTIDEAPESIAVTTEILTTDLTLDEYSNSAVSLLEEQFPNFALLEKVNATLSGFPAHQIVYTYTQDGMELKLMQIWAIAYEMVYALTYAGIPTEFDDALPVFQNMVDSFEITGLETNQGQTFSSVFDTYVTSKPQGYGVYEEKESNTFRPGEDMILYIEPIGFEYGSLIDKENNTLYSINFTADFIISDTEGNVLTGQQGLPVSEVISYHQNEEVFIPFTISQTSPFPPGNYIITYTITDENSGNSFDITRDITISQQSLF